MLQNKIFKQIQAYLLSFFYSVDPQVERQQALLASAEKWSVLVDIKKFSEVNIGPSECPCCIIWRTVDNCKGCPVSSFTNIDGCINTPFTAAYKHYKNRDLKNFKKAARAELNFLLALVYGNYEKAERLCKKYR